MNEYTEKIMLKLGIEKGSLEDIKNSIDSIAKAKDIKFDVDKESFKDADKLVKSFKRTVQMDVINPKKWAKAFKDAAKEKGKQSLQNIFAGGQELTKENVAANAVNKLSGIVKSGFDSVLTSFKEAWTELRTLIGYSKLSNKETREQMFTYGFTFAENYAFDKTMNLLGLSDIEDVWYMNNQEQQKFREKFAEYTDRYNQLYDQGFFEEMQEYDWEMEEFKEDLKYSFMQWFVDNRDVIKSGMEAIMTIAKFFLKIVGWIFGSSTETVKSSEISNNTSYQYGNTSNVQVDVGGVTNNFSGNNASAYLSNPAEMTYKQIIQVLTPGRYAY